MKSFLKFLRMWWDYDRWLRLQIYGIVGKDILFLAPLSWTRFWFQEGFDCLWAFALLMSTLRFIRRNRIHREFMRDLAQVEFWVKETGRCQEEEKVLHSAWKTGEPPDLAKGLELRQRADVAFKRMKLELQWHQLKYRDYIAGKF